MNLSFVISATAAEVFTYIGYVLLAILALMVMIVIHESGHYLAGKMLGFKIEEFAIGFGPAIFKKKLKSGEQFSLRPIPVGGFCSFKGEDEENPDPEAFNNQKPWKRLIVLFAGAFFNFLSSIFFITLFFAIYGQVLPVVKEVKISDSGYETPFKEGDAILAINGKQVNIMLSEDVELAFSKAGDVATFKVLRNGKTVKFEAKKDYFKVFQEGDLIVKINDTELSKDNYIDPYENPQKIEDFLPENAKEASFKVLRGESEVSFTAQRTENESWCYKGYGVTRGIGVTKLPFFRALGRSFGFAFFVVFKILASLGALLTGKVALSSAGGTITVVKTIAESTMMSFSNLLYVVAIVSANLAVMNLLPIPALDGARMVFTVIEWIRGKPLNRKVEGIIHTVGLILLLVLAVFLDIFHLVS